MFFFESVYSLLFSADAPAQPEPRPEPQPESQPESVRDSLEPEFVLPSERVRKWVASTFALDYHCHEDTLHIRVVKKVGESFSPEEMLWVLAKMDNENFRLMSGSRRDCLCGCTASSDCDSDDENECECLCSVPEHFTAPADEDFLRLFLLFEAARTPCKSFSKDEWYEMILDCPVEGLMCLYAGGRRVFDFDERHARYQSPATTMFFYERGLIKSLGPVLLAHGIQSRENALKFFQECGKSIDELIADELECARYSHADYRESGADWIGVKRSFLGYFRFSEIRDLGVVAGLLNFASDHDLPVHHTPIIRHLMLLEHAPFDIDTLCALRKHRIHLPNKLSKRVRSTVACPYTCCGGLLTIEEDPRYSELMAMSYVSPKDIDLVVDQVSDCCRGRAFMAMLDTGGDIVDSIMDLVDI
jgi:hypothetical protein